ncbi:DEAD/DEAH box helicase domain protein [Candidatus Desulforudis audaxviator MP104C]|uniref:DEAD/DEAH box helicase domain protein n=1 Tax=Desulforudis audaxviator (strain MP104C) TaxID=477974 RepID=B1I2W4_DESAP|nr:DEAD/DEAH box helicase domain protein [Candidatus Desulforudis audaxviator MP104C]
MSVQKIVSALRAHPEYSRAVVGVLETPARDAAYRNPFPPLPEPIRSYLERESIELYTHQAEVLERARKKQNVVLTTATASGKSLAFTLPVLEQLYQNPGATALYLYPMKALAYDQLSFLRKLERETGIAYNPAVYDGDTPQLHRKQIRQESRIVLTNPHALHRYLSWHKLWQRFFRGLQYVIIDEGHWYRGLYGSHVAFVFRRLLRVLEHYGATPQIILASATMADPAKHGRNLTGKDFSVVDGDGSARSKKIYVLWDAVAAGKSEHLQAAELFAACVGSGLQAICFAPSRKLAVLTARWAGQKVAGVASYRAGYLPEERRELESRLRSGEIRGVACTNALELGVNIGELDAAIISGWPGTVASFRQQAGRVGRSGQESLVVQIFFSNPLDGYLLRNPELIFRASSEQAVVALDHFEILKAHIRCAAEELPLTAGDEKYFGPRYKDAVRTLIKEKSIVLDSQGWQPGRETCVIKRYVSAGKNVASRVSLSAFDEGAMRLLHDGRLLETLSLSRACRDAHPGAVYLHRGEPYEVREFDPGRGIVTVERSSGELYTQAQVHTAIYPRQTLQTREFPGVVLNVGRVVVSQKTRGYLVKKYDEVIGRHILEGMPSVNLDTVAAWLQLQRIPLIADLEGGLHAAEHTLIAVAPLVAMCDRWDIGGVSLPRDRDGMPAIYVYDDFPGHQLR